MAVAAVSIATCVVASSAFGAAQPIVAADDFFSAATYTMDQGDRPVLQNVGPENNHNVSARTNGPDGDLLFTSPTIGPGQTTLNGTQYLTAGTYAFFCDVHPLSMSGNLQVSGAGAPVARPKVDVTAAGGKISKVAKKGKLPIKVKALTQSAGVTIELRLGKALLGTQSAFDLVAGQQRKLSVKLTKGGKKKLAGRSKATIKVTGSVPFGSPDSAKAKLK